jgi:hypothetical protein
MTSLVISFDVGLMNMAMCVVRVSHHSIKTFDIIEWELFDIGSDNVEECSSLLVKRLKNKFQKTTDSKNTWVIIERQVPQNIKCMCLSHTLLSFFLTKYDKMHVSCVSAISKPLVSKGKKRKSECVKVLKEYLQDSSETNKVWLAWFELQNKKDDLADAFLQIVGNSQYLVFYEEPKTIIEILDDD